MPQSHTSVLNITVPATQRAARRFRLVCGACADNVLVEDDCADRHIRCPLCSSTIKGLRSTRHTCERCGAKVSADLAGGLTVAVCEQCGHPYLLGPVPAPVRRKRRRRHRSRPRDREIVAGTDGIGIIVLIAVILLGAMAVVLLVIS